MPTKTQAARVAAAHAAMREACDAFNAAYRAGAGAATLNALRTTHYEARSAWHRARAAAGDTASAALIAIGAA